MRINVVEREEINKQRFFEMLDEYNCIYDENNWCGVSVKFPVICPNGSEWNPKPEDVIGRKMNRCGCKLCGFRNGASSGEIITAYLFRKYNVDYEEEKTFRELISDKGSKLRFDFMVGNHLLEIHGNQHFDNKKSGFGSSIENDRKKEKFAIENGYNYLVLGVEKDWYGWVYRTDFPLIEKINRFLKDNGFVQEDIEFTKEDKQKCMDIAFKGRLKYKVYDIWTEELVFETNTYTDVNRCGIGISLKLASELNGIKPFKNNDNRLVLNEDYIVKEQIDFGLLREEVNIKIAKRKEKEMEKERKREKYKVKFLNDEMVYSFEKIIDIESKYGYRKFSTILTEKNRDLPKEVEYVKINNEVKKNYKDSKRRCYVFYKNGFINSFESRKELEEFFGFKEGAGNSWTKKGFPKYLDDNIEYMFLKGNRVERTDSGYSLQRGTIFKFVTTEGETLTFSTIKEVGKYYGVSIGWYDFYKNNKKLVDKIARQVVSFEVTNQ